MKVGTCDTTNPGQTHDADCDCSRYRREVAGEIVGDLEDATVMHSRPVSEAFGRFVSINNEES